MAERLKARAVKAAFRRWPIFSGDRERLALEGASFGRGEVPPGSTTERRLNFMKEVLARHAVSREAAEAIYETELRKIEERYADAAARTTTRGTGRNASERPLSAGEVETLEGFGFSRADYLSASYLSALRTTKVSDFLQKETLPTAKYAQLAQFVRILTENDPAHQGTSLGEFLRLISR